MKQFKTIYDYSKDLAAAIDKAIREHGSPNTFSFSELNAFYGGPTPMLAGRALRGVIECELVQARVNVSRTPDGRVAVEDKKVPICPVCDGPCLGH